MGQACGQDVGNEECIQNFGVETSQETSTWKMRKLASNIKKNLSEISCGSGRWIELAQACAQWWGLLLVVLNVWVLLPQN